MRLEAYLKEGRGHYELVDAVVVERKGNDIDNPGRTGKAIGVKRSTRTCLSSATMAYGTSFLEMGDKRGDSPHENDLQIVISNVEKYETYQSSSSEVY